MKLIGIFFVAFLSVTPCYAENMRGSINLQLVYYSDSQGRTASQAVTQNLAYPRFSSSTLRIVKLRKNKYRVTTSSNTEIDYPVCTAKGSHVSCSQSDTFYAGQGAFFANSTSFAFELNKKRQTVYFRKKYRQVGVNNVTQFTYRGVMSIRK